MMIRFSLVSGLALLDEQELLTISRVIVLRAVKPCRAPDGASQADGRAG